MANQGQQPPDQQLLAQPQPPPVRVARTPAQYTIVQPLDFSQRNDITVFKNGCAAREETSTTGQN